jgi:hypothetical protein
VIRWVNIQQAGAAANLLSLFIGSGGNQVASFYSSTSDSGLNREIHCVYHEGEQCTALAYGAAATLNMAGYLFTGAGAPLVPGTLPS